MSSLRERGEKDGIRRSRQSPVIPIFGDQTEKGKPTKSQRRCSGLGRRKREVASWKLGGKI